MCSDIYIFELYTRYINLVHSLCKDTQSPWIPNQIKYNSTKYSSQRKMGNQTPHPAIRPFMVNHVSPLVTCL